MNELELFAALVAMNEPADRVALLDQHCAGEEKHCHGEICEMS